MKESGVILFGVGRELHKRGLISRYAVTLGETCAVLAKLTGREVPLLRKQRWEMVNEWAQQNEIRAKIREHRKQVKEHKKKREMTKNFYASREWYAVRYQALKKYGGLCQCCGSRGPLHVDHIKPRSIFPEMELSLENLQVLCEACNIGKSNVDQTDWRQKTDASAKNQYSI